MVELVAPLNRNLPCAVTNMVDRQSCVPYHICLKTDDLDAEIKRLRRKGVRQVGKVLTSDIYGYEAVGVFLYGKGMGLIELVQESETDE